VTGWQAILGTARSEREAFDRARAEPRSAQWSLLQGILAANTESEFGRAHGFAEICSVEAFRAQVPVRGYDELRPWLDRVSNGEANILTREPVIAFEETGGSTSGRKLIPYTALSLLAFRAAVLPWLTDLAQRRPGAFAGKAYVAVSPATRAPRTIAGIPVGLASEGAYLGADLIPAFAAVLAVPPAVARLADIEQWKLATLAHLLAASELTIVSVWSPTFLTGLLDALPGLAEPLARAVRDGTFGAGGPSLEAPPADPDRARLIDRALTRRPIDTQLIWPRLDTVSVWADGASRFYARRLQEMLPHARLQPKGLLATEGAVTTPCGDSWPVPALTSTFLEFIDTTGRPLLCDQLREGESYRVVMTTPGGFYRYDLGDRLRCRGHAAGLPLLEFVGRDAASDLVGEKLSEHFVSDVLSSDESMCSVDSCLAPRAAARPFYELLVEAKDDRALEPMAALVDERLCANPQYAYARAVGQLGPVVSRAVDGLLDRYMRAQTLRGRRLADIKPPTLIDDAGIYAALTNQVDSESPDFRAPSLHA
jgi:GH3 auxin-responsive promoter